MEMKKKLFALAINGILVNATPVVISNDALAASSIESSSVVTNLAPIIVTDNESDLPISFKLINPSLEPDVYTLQATDSKGWSLSQLPTSVEVKGKETVNLELKVKLPATNNVTNLITVTATSRNDPTALLKVRIPVIITAQSTVITFPSIPGTETVQKATSENLFNPVMFDEFGNVTTWCPIFIHCPDFQICFIGPFSKVLPTLPNSLNIEQQFLEPDQICNFVSSTKKVCEELDPTVNQEEFNTRIWEEFLQIPSEPTEKPAPQEPLILPKIGSLKNIFNFVSIKGISSTQQRWVWRFGASNLKRANKNTYLQEFDSLSQAFLITLRDSLEQSGSFSEFIVEEIDNNETLLATLILNSQNSKFTQAWYSAFAGIPKEIENTTTLKTGLFEESFGRFYLIFSEGNRYYQSNLYPALHPDIAKALVEAFPNAIIEQSLDGKITFTQGEKVLHLRMDYQVVSTAADATTLSIKENTDNEGKVSYLLSIGSKEQIAYGVDEHE
jgi:hypothetical protein